MLLLQVIDLHKSFGNVKVLDGLNLSLEPGRVYTLKGGNGSGKTTFLNILSGFVQPDRGSVLFKGKELIGMKPFNISRQGVKRTFQDLRIVKGMTVTDNLLLYLDKNLFSATVSQDKKSRIDEVLKLLDMERLRNSPAGNLSIGQQKLLTLACCIADNSSLLLLDEPASTLSQGNIELLYALEKRMAKLGKTVLQVEHNLDFIDEVSDEVFVLENGKLHAAH